jgi:capsular polysaccharide transport system permease protein
MAQQHSRMRFPSDLFLQGFKVQARCLYALMIREMMMRYGRDNLGFLWIFIEPMLLCVGVMLLWTFIHAPFEHGITVVALVLTGYMPLTLWRHMTTNAAILPFKRSAALLYHRHVSLLDVFLTRIFLEYAGSTTAFALVSGALVALNLVEVPHDIGLVIAGWLLMGLFSTGAALVITLLTESSEVSERFVPVFQYLMLPISGCFFMVDWLPTFAQNLIWYNPTVHCYEMIRAGFFGDSVQTYFSPWYPAACALSLIALGIGFIDRMRDHIHA